MTSTSRVSDRLLIPWLAALSLVATIAVLQSLLLPARPQVDDLPRSSIQQALRRAGLVVTPLPSRPARSRADLTLSRQLGWTLADGSQLWIVHGAVRRYEDLQAASLARATPGLHLQNRRLASPLPAAASGRIAGHPAVQTCLVPQSRGLPLPGVTRSALLRASDPRRSLADLRDPRHWNGILISFLRPRRFSCVLVSLRSGSTAPLPPGMWARLLPAMQGALQSPEPDCVLPGCPALPGAMHPPHSVRKTARGLGDAAAVSAFRPCVDPAGSLCRPGDPTRPQALTTPPG